MEPPRTRRGPRGSPGPVLPALPTLAAADPAERPRLLGGARDGLADAEAARRQAAFGPNTPVREAARHVARDFVANFTHTLALLLWFAGGLAFAAGIEELGAAIFAVVVINGVFAFVQEYRAGRVVQGLLETVALRAQVLRAGEARTIDAAEVVPGDIVRLEAGAISPADCILLEAENLAVDLSLLTGETLPVERTPGALEVAAGTHLADIPSVVPAGAGIVTGSAVAIAWATGAASSLGRVAGLVETVRRGESLLERQVAALSRTTATVAVLAGAVTLTMAAFLGDTSFLVALTFATGVIVALVPEGLLPTLSVSLAIGARRMAGRGAAVRRLSAVEVVGGTTVICTDKTGTLTQNRLTVSDFVPAGRAGAAEESLLVAALCNEAEPGPTGPEGDPFDVALWQWAHSRGADPLVVRGRWPTVDSVAFDAHRRYAAVTCDAGAGRRVFAKGAPEAVAALCSPGALDERLTAAVDRATSRGERVLMLAAGPGDGQLLAAGIVAFHDPPREGVAGAIAACERAGIRVAMLTGDHPETAQAVASRIGLGARGLAVADGETLNRMTDRELIRLLATDAVIARVDPEQKLRIVQVLRSAGEVVLVTGDGINDAPALRAADVGVAMGLRGTEVAKQAADIVLADDNFVTIVAAIEEGRSIKDNIRRFVSYVFTSNVAEMAPFVFYIFLPIPLPLAVIQALAIDIGTDLIPALALGAEPPSEDTISRPPEPPSRPLMTRKLGALTFLFFGALEAALGLAGYFLYFAADGWRPFDSFAPFEGIEHQAMAVTFLAIVGGQLGCLAAQRSGSLRRRLSVRANPLVGAGIAFELALAAALVYTPGLNGLFSMDPVAPAWLLTVPVAAALFLAADQLRRLFVRGRPGRA